MVELDANKAQQTVEPNMQPLSPSQRSHILSLLIGGHSAHQISSSTGISYTSITRLRSKHLPDLPKPTGGRPSKLSPSNMRFAQRLISSGKADNAVQVTKALQTITNQPLSPQTTRRNLRQHGMKAVVKRKRPQLLPRHKQQRLDFALTHKDWTVEDWKRVVWSD